MTLHELGPRAARKPDGRLRLVGCRIAIREQARGGTLGTSVRAIRESDHVTVTSVVNEWWESRDMAWLLPRLFFQHFADTSFAVEEDGELIAFLIGFVSQSREGEAYIHFVGVRPDRRKEGIGRHLYELFFEEVEKRRCTKVGCITSPVNEGSIAFHSAMGFSLKESDTEIDGVSVHRHYDGPGRDRVVFEKGLYS
jgi:predicted GNAT superfamily acetyltransferase